MTIKISNEMKKIGKKSFGGYWALESVSTEVETGVMGIFGCQDLIYGCRYLHFQLKLLESK